MKAEEFYAFLVPLQARGDDTSCCYRVGILLTSCMSSRMVQDESTKFLTHSQLYSSRDDSKMAPKKKAAQTDKGRVEEEVEEPLQAVVCSPALSMSRSH